MYLHLRFSSAYPIRHCLPAVLVFRRCFVDPFDLKTRNLSLYSPLPQRRLLLLESCLLISIRTKNTTRLCANCCVGRFGSSSAVLNWMLIGWIWQMLMQSVHLHLSLVRLQPVSECVQCWGAAKCSAPPNIWERPVCVSVSPNKCRLGDKAALWGRYRCIYRVYSVSNKSVWPRASRLEY